MAEERASLADFEKWCQGVIPHEFEEIVADIFRSTGVDATVTSRSGDGGYDVVLRTSDPGSHPVMCGESALVEVKRQAGSYDVVSPGVLQRLLEAAETRDPDQLIIVANRAHSNPLKEQANGVEDYHVDLLLAEDLFDLAGDETIATLMDTYESRPGLKQWWNR